MSKVRIFVRILYWYQLKRRNFKVEEGNRSTQITGVQGSN